MEEELDGMRILIYGNISEETFAKQQRLLYLVNKYEE
jgi:hypothetical protein